MIFIDEIDAIGFKRKSLANPFRGGVQSTNREAETTLNQLLNEMDGFQSNQNILVVAATNLIENIDDALIRPGRFDHKIEIKLPEAPERAQILKIHLQNKKHQLQQRDISEAATFLKGFTGAEIENLVNLTALSCVRNNEQLSPNVFKAKVQEMIASK